MALYNVFWANNHLRHKTVKTNDKIRHFADLQLLARSAVFQCDLCDAGYVGYTLRHLHNRVKGHNQQSSTIAKHYKNMHRTMPEDLLKYFKVLRKGRNKFDCLVYEMLFIRALKPNLNVQSDSIRGKVFSYFFLLIFYYFL